MDLHYNFISDVYRAREMSGDGYARGNITLGDGYASGDIIDSWTIPGGEETDLSDPGSDDLDSLDQRNVQEKNYSGRENWRTPPRSVVYSSVPSTGLVLERTGLGTRVLLLSRIDTHQLPNQSAHVHLMQVMLFRRC